MAELYTGYTELPKMFSEMNNANSLIASREQAMIVAAKEQQLLDQYRQAMLQDAQRPQFQNVNVPAVMQNIENPDAPSANYLAMTGGMGIGVQGGLEQAPPQQIQQQVSPARTMMQRTTPPVPENAGAAMFAKEQEAMLYKRAQEQAAVTEKKQMAEAKMAQDYITKTQQMVLRGELSPENAQKVNDSLRAYVETVRKRSPENTFLEGLEDQLGDTAAVGSQKKGSDGKTTQVVRYGNDGKINYGHYEGNKFIEESTGVKPIDKSREQRVFNGPPGTGILRTWNGQWFRPEIDPASGKETRKSLSGQQVEEAFARAGANRKSFEGQIKQFDALDSFVNNIEGNVDKLKTLMSEVSRYDSRLMNIPLVKWRTEIAGSPNEAKLNMLYTELSTEASKVASGAQQSIAAPPEGARIKWDAIHDNKLSASEIVEVADFTLNLAKQRRETVKDTAEGIGKRTQEQRPVSKLLTPGTGTSSPKAASLNAGKTAKIPPGAKTGTYKNVKAYTTDEKNFFRVDNGQRIQ